MAKNVKPSMKKKPARAKTAAKKTAKPAANAKIVARAKLNTKPAPAKTTKAPVLAPAPVAAAPAPEVADVWKRAQNPDPRQQFKPQSQFRGKSSLKRGRFSGFGGRRAA